MYRGGTFRTNILVILVYLQTKRTWHVERKPFFETLGTTNHNAVGEDKKAKPGAAVGEDEKAKHGVAVQPTKRPPATPSTSSSSCKYPKRDPEVTALMTQISEARDNTRAMVQQLEQLAVRQLARVGLRRGVTVLV